MEGNKRKALLLLSALAATAAGIFCCANLAQAEDTCNDHVVISQIYGGGGNSGAVYKNDFIELYNPTDRDIVLDNWSIQYAAATVNFPTTTSKVTVLAGTIKANSYFLVQEYAGSNEATSLPAPDHTGSINLAAGSGKIALVRNSDLINSETDGAVDNYVAYEGGDNATSIFRNLETCPNAFFTSTPNPRNSSVTENNNDDPTNDDDTTDDTTDDEASGGDDGTDSPEVCLTSSTDIRLNEIFPFPGTGDEFVEIANIGEGCVDVSGWKIMDNTNHKKSFPAESLIDPGEYLILEGNLFLNNDSDTVYLLDVTGISPEDALDQRSYDKEKKNQAYAFRDNEFFWTSFPTPGEENIFDPEKPATSNFSFSEKVRLTEIYPNPKDTSSSEYIEIQNEDSESVDLFGWMIRDASKTGKYVFKEHIVLKPGKFLAVYKSLSKIALNNSKETVSLFDPDNNPISTVSYDKSQKGASYNFDGNTWKWSKYLTPKKENKFDSPPTVKIKKVKNAFKNIFTEFSANAKDKETRKLKYTWDFGDGRKSYLAETSHKYLATGSYRVTLTVRDDSQAVEKSFSVKVKKYPRPDLEIMKLLPNPAGKDEEGEIVDIKNNSQKKIDLKDWKIATGSSVGNISNHPISEEIILFPGEAKTITREFSKFSLNNKAGKVQLVFPDGKIADSVEYQKDKIAEGVAYIKLNDEWVWLSPDAPKDSENITEDDEEIIEAESTDEGEILGAADSANFFARHTGFTSEDAYIFLSRINFGGRSGELNYSPITDPSSNIAFLIASLI